MLIKYLQQNDTYLILKFIFEYMKLANHIKDLLYRYDCVIVPNFGGFVTNRIGATLDKNSDTFFPPTKKISFNHHLNKSDGLLINHVAVSEGISYQEASDRISTTVNQWQVKLEKGDLSIEAIGKLRRNDQKQLVFEPNESFNFLIDSFGLDAVVSSPIDRPAEVKVIQPNGEPQKTPWLKYAAAATVAIMLGLAGNNIYQNNEIQKEFSAQEKALEKKIQSATFQISNPLPTIELNITKKDSKPFHVMAGSFQFSKNAKKKVNQLIKKGYQAEVIGFNDWGLTQVAFQSFENRIDAVNFLKKIKENESKDAWLLTK